MCWWLSGNRGSEFIKGLTELMRNINLARPFCVVIHPKGTMGMEESKEMLFWTKEEYLKFAEEMMDKPLSYYAFEMLYWCGIREGELLALTPADFNFENQTVTINKSYQRLKGRDVITTPKTKEHPHP